MRRSWVIYVCRGCGEAVASGTASCGPDCRGGGFEEIRVVRERPAGAPRIPPSDPANCEQKRMPW